MENHMREHLENLEGLLKKAGDISTEKLPCSLNYPESQQQRIKIVMETMYGHPYYLEISLSRHNGQVTVYRDRTPITTYTIQEQEKTFLGIPYPAHSLSVKEESTGQETSQDEYRITGAIYRRLYSCIRSTIERGQSVAQQRQIPNISVRSIIKQLLAVPWQER